MNTLSAETRNAQRHTSHSRQGIAGLASAILVPGLVSLLLTMAPLAKGQGTTGTITGTVTDTTGAAIPGAKVTVTQIETNAVHKVITWMRNRSGTLSRPGLRFRSTRRSR